MSRVEIGMANINQAGGGQRAPLSVLIAAKNEAANIRRCLDAVTGWADEVVVADSHSVDGTPGICNEYGATVLQFDYRGGWPKKRQWVLDNYQFRNEWILLLDADEIVTPALRDEIALAIDNPSVAGYYVSLAVVFLGKQLRFGDTKLYKLSLFRRSRGGFECRVRDQDQSMCDMEVHEHVVVKGCTARLRSPVRHENLKRLDEYIHKHNAYSNWEALVFLKGDTSELVPSLFGNQAQRRRWLKMRFQRLPGFPGAVFVYTYLFRLGFLDGRPGLIYCMFKAIQRFHVRAKIYETRLTLCSDNPQMTSHIGACK